jgi:LPS sulfotransferase NodH
MGRLVVILSTERSGSTLLTAMLGGSRRIIAPPETHLFRYASFEDWRQSKPEALSSLAWVMEAAGQAADVASLSARFSGLAPVKIYEELLRLCGPDQLLVDKTPAYARDSAVLKRIECLEPFYVWLVRHPLAVVSSSIDRRRQRRRERRRRESNLLKKVPRAISEARDRLWRPKARATRRKLPYWCDVHGRIEAFLAEVPSERSIRIHFESLVRAPVEELNRLCAWLGVELEPAMLEPQGNVPESLAWGLGSEKVRPHSRVDARIADGWREQLDARLLDPRTREIMARIGVEE